METLIRNGLDRSDSLSVSGNGAIGDVGDYQTFEMPFRSTWMVVAKIRVWPQAFPGKDGR